MATTTQHYGFTKPAMDEAARISVLNTNFDNIDTAIYAASQSGGANNAIMRANTYGGNDLGTEVTADQLAAIQNGTFEGLLIGDYWTINSTIWRIADMNYFKGVNNFTDNHLVLIPDNALYNSTFPSSTYAAAKSTLLADAETAITAAFGTMIKEHSIILEYGSVQPTAVSTRVDLMREIQVFGYKLLTLLRSDSMQYSSNEYQQFALFRLDKQAIISCKYWLRDLGSNSRFVYVRDDGNIRTASTDNSMGIRPFFCIG